MFRFASRHVYVCGARTAAPLSVTNIRTLSWQAHDHTGAFDNETTFHPNKLFKIVNNRGNRIVKKLCELKAERYSGISRNSRRNEALPTGEKLPNVIVFALVYQSTVSSVNNKWVSLSEAERQTYEHITPMMMYTQANLERLRAETPWKNDVQLVETWHSLSDEEKAVYQQQSIDYMRQIGVPATIDIEAHLAGMADVVPGVTVNFPHLRVNSPGLKKRKKTLSRKEVFGLTLPDLSDEEIDEFWDELTPSQGNKYKHIPPFTIYKQEHMARMRKEHPQKNSWELLNHMISIWKRVLSSRERAAYEEKSIAHLHRIGVPYDVDIRAILGSTGNATNELKKNSRQKLSSHDVFALVTQSEMSVVNARWQVMSDKDKDVFKHVTPVMMYKRANLELMRKQNPGMHDMQLSSKLGQKWSHSLTAEERAVYEQKSIAYMHALGVPDSIDIQTILDRKLKDPVPVTNNLDTNSRSQVVEAVPTTKRLNKKLGSRDVYVLVSHAKGMGTRTIYDTWEAMANSERENYSFISPFMMYHKEMFKNMRAANPNHNSEQLFCLISDIWEMLGPEERSTYEEKSIAHLHRLGVSKDVDLLSHLHGKISVRSTALFTDFRKLCREQATKRATQS